MGRAHSFFASSELTSGALWLPRLMKELVAGWTRTKYYYSNKDRVNLPFALFKGSHLLLRSPHGRRGN